MTESALSDANPAASTSSDDGPPTDRLLALYLAGRPEQVIDACSGARSALGLQQRLLLLQAQFECGLGAQAVDDLWAQYGSAGSWPAPLFDASEALLAAACVGSPPRAARARGGGLNVQQLALTLQAMRIARIRILAERLRAATGQVVQHGAAACTAKSEARPAMPDERMIEQALFQTPPQFTQVLRLERAVIICSITNNSYFILQQSSGDPGSSGSVFGGGIEADISLLRSHLSILPSSSPSLLHHNLDDCHYNGNSLDSHCRGSECATHVTSVPALAVLESAAVSRGSAGGGVCSQRRTADGRGEVASHGAAAVNGSNIIGRGFWRSQVARVCSSWWARVMTVLRWLRLLDLWHVLRRRGSALMQLVIRAIIRVVHALQSISGDSSSSGAERVRRQQMLLVTASIVLMAILVHSDEPFQSLLRGANNKFRRPSTFKSE